MDFRNIFKLGACLLAALPVYAQVTFDVASIKPNKSGGESYFRATVRGDLYARNVSLRTIIEDAYEVPDWQISGGPAWPKSEKYDVQAKGPHVKPFASGEEIVQMEQALLADRFQLKIHHEKRELPMFALVIAKGGPKLVEASGANCFVVTRTTKPADMGGLPQCGAITGRRGDLTGLKVPTSTISDQLTYLLHTFVSDETGLAGHDYDIHLKWNPNDIALSAAPDPKADSFGPSLFTALGEQLGLKLKSRKGPVNVIVIDRAEPPSKN